MVIDRTPCHMVIVSWAGDYGEAWKRLERGGPENYYAQRYSVNSVSELAKDVGNITFYCLNTSEPYDEVLSNGVRAVGLGSSCRRPWMSALRHFEQERPTHLVLQFPDWRLLAWAIARRIDTTLVLADSFQSPQKRGNAIKSALRSVRHQSETKLFAGLLRSRHVRWVGNHNIPASRDLERIGVPATKIIPWDWPPIIRPADFPCKLAPRGRRVHLLFVGMLTQTKGADDVIDALSALRAKGVDADLALVGGGEEERLRARRDAANLTNFIEFAGKVSHEEVVKRFATCDAAIVPSWPEYPEGLPMTVYEALATRTPLVCSDHPMFVSLLSGKVAMYPAKNVEALASAVEHILEPRHYEAASAAAEEVWRSILCTVHPVDIMRASFMDSPSDRKYLESMSLAHLNDTSVSPQVHP